MPRNSWASLRTVGAVALLLGVATSGWSSRLDAAPDDAKKPRGGATYRNARLGVRARGPVGWKMVADRAAAPTRWQRLVTYNDRTTDAQATLSVRPRVATTLDDLTQAVRKDWAKSGGRLSVSSLQKVAANALNKNARVIVDGSFTRKPRPAKSKTGVPAPPSAPVPYKVKAVYYLGPGYTYLLYAQGQATHWSRLRAPLKRLAASVTFDKAVPTGPTGEGSYRSDREGFTCRFPKGYTVVTPQRENHLVQFQGVGADEASLSVYGFKFEAGAAKDAERLVAYYEEDKGGTASARSMEVAGRSGMRVAARAMISGVDRVILIAVVKRGEDCFRLRASMPASAETKGVSAFRAFVTSFRFAGGPR